MTSKANRGFDEVVKITETATIAFNGASNSSSVVDLPKSTAETFLYYHQHENVLCTYSRVNA